MAERLLLYCITIAILFIFACCPVRASHCDEPEGTVRLVNGPSSREGRVEVCVEGRRHTPCQETWGLEETRVVCRQLGFCQQGGSVSDEYYYPINEFHVNCTGNEATLSNCSLNTLDYCDNYRSAGVACHAQIPHKPTNMEIEVIDLFSIQLTWSPPDMSNCTDIDEYRISCNFSYPCSYTNTRQTTSITTFLHDYYFYRCNYTCCVSGSNSAGESPQECALKPRPTPPRNVTVSSIQPTLLQIEWIEPEQINGDFDLYSVVCGNNTRNIYSITETAVNMTGLSVFTRYECCVTAQAFNYYDYTTFSSSPSCVNATTAADLPTAPLALNIPGITYKSIQLKWSRPQPINGIISHYTITCLQANGTIVRLNTTADGLETVSNLRPLTNYTCCISATNQVGKGNNTCVDARTERGSPTEPQELVAIVSAYTNGITLTWTEPAESYGQAILFYSINCTSTHHNVEIQRAYITSVNVSVLDANTNYTCCVSAGNSVGVGLHQCIIVMTAKLLVYTEQPQQPQTDSNQLVTAVSAGVLLAVLLLLCIVITCITCCCCYKRKTSKQGQQSADPVYDVPEDIELKEKGSSTLRSGPQNNDTSRRHVYKEEVEIRYEKPVLASSGGTATNKKQKEEKPMMLIASPSITQPGQQSSEKIYQPLIPPKTYKEQEVSAYQDLAFETRDAGTDVANNSEGQYEPIRKNDEDDQYEPLSFGGGGTSQEEGAYQPLSFQREDDNTYETIQTTTTRT
ncbi:phosphatidylinositol phosphatase PTPRQ-like isoform X2 [Halichondria panicea]|uniref:phosphatidylinositol phosphatase PTPRQ-like isoform X2 n=1 Tax=Halichondria panicea TaxID=6063 RepID=UPI00312B5F1A